LNPESIVVVPEGRAAVIHASEFSSAVTRLPTAPLATTANGSCFQLEPCRIPACDLTSTSRTPPSGVVAQTTVRSMMVDAAGFALAEDCVPAPTAASSITVDASAMSLISRGSSWAQ
jgi:hypothetical protein